MVATAILRERLGFIDKNHLDAVGGKLQLVDGRYYAATDKRWERVALAYNAMVKGEGEKAISAIEAVKTVMMGVTTNLLNQPLLPKCWWRSGNYYY